MHIKCQIDRKIKVMKILDCLDIRYIDSKLSHCKQQINQLEIEYQQIRYYPNIIHIKELESVIDPVLSIVKQLRTFVKI